MKDTIFNSEGTNEIISLSEKKTFSDTLQNKDGISPLLKYSSFFEKSPLFEEKNLKKWEILFDEGNIDSNLYIIKKWILSVEKYTTNEKTHSKQLALLKSGDFVWENGLSSSIKPKEAKIICIEDAQLLQIDLKQDLKKFWEENPSIGFELLRHIITETNQRLSETNKLFASHYELEKTIQNLKNIDLKWIFMILEKVKAILDVDYILYFEKNKVLENFLTLRYDSRTPNKMLDLTFEKKWIFIDLDELYLEANISQDDEILINKISIWNEIFGYLILWRETRAFDGSDKKLLWSTSNSLAWVIKKYLWDKEEQNKFYISEMKK